MTVMACAAWGVATRVSGGKNASSAILSPATDCIHAFLIDHSKEFSNENIVIKLSF
jgi:hypothetical protein